MATVESRSEIEKALEAATAVAKVESGMADRHLKEAADHVYRTTGQIDRAASELSQRGPLIDDLRNRGLRLARDLQVVLSEKIEKARSDLDSKQESLNKFTITLFGRTQAGKSTIREAITRGTGETIGKGAQRTTREVRRYEWNRLTLIDTPGIAAYRGEEDEVLAYSSVSASDVIIFLLTSDSIQLEEFEAMAKIRAKNKPLLFVLNIKSDLTQPVMMKRALRDERTIYDRGLIEGCRSRIQTLAGDWLDVRNPEIVEVHAQAAFLATRPDNGWDCRRLHALSRFDRLERKLLEELTERGTTRRLQTIYDSSFVSLNPVPDDFTEVLAEIKLNSDSLTRKMSELEEWFNRYKRELRGEKNSSVAKNSRIRNEVRAWLSPLRNHLPHVIERHIDDSKLNRKVKEEYEKLNLQDKIRSFAENIQSEVRDKILDLLRALEAEIPFMRIKMTDELQHFGAVNTNQLFGRISAGASVVGAIAFVAAGFSAANFWNPLGWAAAGVAIVAGICSWFSSDHGHERRKAVAKAQKKADKKLDEMEESISKDFEAWFDREIDQRAITPALSDSRSFCEALTQIMGELQFGRRQIQEMIEKMNRRLLSRSISLAGGKLSEYDIVHLVRLPGYQTKFTHSAQNLNPRVLAKVEDNLTEWINPISAKSDRPTQVAEAFRPARVSPSDVRILASGIAVSLSQDQLGLAWGKKRKNHYLACQLFRTKIRLERKERP